MVRKLAAGREDVVATAPSNARGEPGIRQDLEKPRRRVRRRAPVRCPRPWVVTNKVDLRFDPSKVQREPFRIFRPVVLPSEKDVLERDAASLWNRKRAGRREEILERVFPVDGHHAVADLVRRGVKADGESDRRRLFGEARELVDHSRRRHGDTARRDRERPVIGQDSEGLQYRLGVQERLTHTHEDDVASGGRLRERVPRQEKLTENLPRGQVPLEADGSREAKTALERAAHLRREAERVAGRLGNVDALDIPPILELDQVLDRAVLRYVLRGGVRPPDLVAPSRASGEGPSEGRSSPRTKRRHERRERGKSGVPGRQGAPDRASPARSRSTPTRRGS